MLTLYDGPGACSMASHIALEESGATYEGKPVALAKGEQQSEAYLKVNPRGKVPALAVDGQVLTENVAILTYVARKLAPALLPDDPQQMARALSIMAWFSNTVHPSFTHVNRPERFAKDPAAHETIRDTGRANFLANLREIDGMLAGKTWMLGETFSVCDGYALVFYGWGARSGQPVKELANYTAHKDRMLQRLAVRRVLERENSPLLAA
jgi:glutathione S-transferase